MNKLKTVILSALALLANVAFAASTTTQPDPLIEQLKTDGLAQQVLATKIKTQLTTLGTSVAGQTKTVTTLTATNAKLTTDNATLKTTNASLTKQVATLIKQLGGSSTFTSTSSTTTSTIPPTPQDPPVTTGDVLVERLGKSYSEYQHPAGETFPNVYLRAVIDTPAGSYRQKTSEGLGTWSTTSGDFSSTQAQVIYVPDDALVIDKTGPNWTNNAGVGLGRIEVENMSNNSLGVSPQPNAIPADYVAEWMQHNGQDETTIGHPIGLARGYGRWSNAAMVLFSNGFVSGDGTATSGYTLLRFQLPTTKKPTAIGVTSGNEFTLISCIDTATGKGQLAIYANFTGKSLQAVAGLSPFYHDWLTPHPGLPSIATYVGAQLLGYVDLGINAPTAISAVASRTSDRINAADGNAGTMGDKDLSLQATRDEFTTGNNTNFISTWGFAVVISKTENKAVYVDMRAMFAGYKTQYTTTQALYDATLPPSGVNWWQEYATSAWPYRFSAKPEWTPTVTATISVPSPTSVLISEHGDGALAVGCEDGVIRFWTGGPSDGSAPVAAGSVQVGRNITCLTYDKFPSQIGTRLGGFFAVSRGDRSVSLLNTWGSGAAVTKTLRDARLIDPVHAEVSDTHGINVGILTVCDFNGRQVLNYRYTPAELVNYGGQVFPIQGGADWECTGVLPFTFGKPIGKPFAVSGTNVN